MSYKQNPVQRISMDQITILDGAVLLYKRFPLNRHLLCRNYIPWTRNIGAQFLLAAKAEFGTLGVKTYAFFRLFEHVSKRIRCSRPSTITRRIFAPASPVAARTCFCIRLHLPSQCPHCRHHVQSNPSLSLSLRTQHKKELLAID